VIEDFVPISDTKALVTGGRSYHRLRCIAEVRYTFTNEGLVLANPIVLQEGEYLRLGHLFNGELIYSDGRDGPHQPHRHGDDVYYAFGEPTSRIYKNGRVHIDLFDGVSQIGKPWVHDGYIYFEGHDSDKEAPNGWNVYRSLMDGTAIQKICRGANPAIYNSILYLTVWAANQFWLVRRTLAALLMAVPQCLCA
jgi:hypothetical protein